MDKSEQNNSKNNSFFSKIKEKLSFFKNTAIDTDSQNDDNDGYWDDANNTTSQDIYDTPNPQKKKKIKPTSASKINQNTSPYDTQDTNDNTDDTHNIEEELDALYAQRVFYDKDNPPPKKINIILVILIAIGIITSLLIIYLMWKAQSRPPLDISAQKATPELSLGEGKLETPILGTPQAEEIHSAPELNKDDPLLKIDFDFSPTISNDIARMPMLPNKITKKKAVTPTSQFQDLWNNGTQPDETELAKNINSTNSKDFLPPWRRYSVDYQPTNGRPVFSIVLDYDPQVLNIDDLPKSSGYNIVMAGFLENSNQIFKTLTDKKFEILLYLPMHEETNRYTLRPIKKDSSFDDIREAINFHASLFGGKGFVGFMNYGGKEVQNILPKINFAMSVLAKTGFLYLDDAHDNTQSLAFAAAEGQKIPSLKTQTYINSVSEEFETFIKHVKNDGTGIAIVKATPENIIALEAYEKLLENEKIHRIPISGILKHQMLNKQEL